MPAKTNPIGVFDSGVGGLTVLKELLDIMPGEDFVYFGDTARVPYGPRTPEEIRKFTRQILRFLAEQKVKLAVIACNTITFNIIAADVADCPFPVIGMNDSVKAALSVSKAKRVGVIATQATVSSAKHVESGKNIDPEAKVYLQACPEFVPIIERGIFDGPEIEAAVKEYLRPLQDVKIDALILACTHYPLVAPLVGRLMGPTVNIINPARETALDAQRLLVEKDLLNPAKEAGKLRIVFSSVSPETENLAKVFLQRALPQLEVKDVSSYFYCI